MKDINFCPKSSMKHHSNKAKETTTRLIVIRLCNLELKKENVKKSCQSKNYVMFKKATKNFHTEKKTGGQMKTE